MSLALEVRSLLKEKGIKVYKAFVGNYFTSLEMKGVTLTLMKLDDELKACMDLPCDTVGLKQLPVDGVSQETLHGQAASVAHTASAGTEKKAAPEAKRTVSGPSFTNKAGSAVVMDLIKTIQTNKDYLCEVDSKIGEVIPEARPLIPVRVLAGIQEGSWILLVINVDGNIYITGKYGGGTVSNLDISATYLAA